MTCCIPWLKLPMTSRTDHYLDQPDRVLHNVFSPKEVDPLIFGSNSRVKDGNRHICHALTGVVDAVVSFHRIQDFLIFTNSTE